MRKIRIIPIVFLFLEILYTVICFISAYIDYIDILHCIIIYGWKIALMLWAINFILLLMLMVKRDKQNKKSNFEAILFTVNFFLVIAGFFGFAFYIGSHF